MPVDAPEMSAQESIVATSYDGVHGCIKGCLARAFVAELFQREALGSLALPSEIQGFFPFDFAQGQNDDLKQTTGTADPYGMTNRKATATAAARTGD